jgi:hypothetical protein
MWKLERHNGEMEKWEEMKKSEVHVTGLGEDQCISIF